MPKVSELNAVSNVSTDDLLLVVNDPNGAPSTNKITIQNFANTMTGMLRYASNSIPGVIKVSDNFSVNATGYLTLTGTETIPSVGKSEGYLLTWDQATDAIKWQAFSGVYPYNVVNSTNVYNVLEHDGIIFCDPNAVSSDITVILPDAASTPPAVVGKTYTIKNINPGNGYKVVVTTFSGDEYGSNYVENPLTGSFVVSYNIVNKGDGQDWIFDGSAWRHLGSQTSLPNFSAEANTFTEIALQNRSSGNNASGDVVVYSDAGDPVTGDGPYVDMGINSSQYSNTEYSVGGPNDSYLYSSGGDLTIGTADPNTSLILHAEGTTNTNIRLTINSTATTVKNRKITLNDLDGPYASDSAAESAGIPVKGLYYDNSGNVKVRLT